MFLAKTDFRMELCLLEKMEWKVERVKMLISNHGNNEGYTVVEAALSVFVAGVLLLAVIGFAVTTKKYSQKINNRVDSYIQYQNEYAEKSK